MMLWSRGGDFPYLTSELPHCLRLLCCKMRKPEDFPEDLMTLNMWISKKSPCSSPRGPNSSGDTSRHVMAPSSQGDSVWVCGWVCKVLI